MKKNLIDIKQEQAKQTVRLTKEFCEKRVLAGESLPGWSTIRKEIGQGSSNTISDALAEFKEELATNYKRILLLKRLDSSILQALDELSINKDNSSLETSELTSIFIKKLTRLKS